LVCLRNRRHDRGIHDGTPVFPVLTAGLIGCGGVLALATGLFLFTAPATAVRYRPWDLTPLTARVLGAVFCLGVAGIGAFVDRRWTTARIPLQAALITLVLIVAAGILASTELVTGDMLTWVLVGGLGALTVTVGAWSVQIELRSRA
jgi:hypothetical protein